MKLLRQQGFTLVELMVAMVISGIIITGIYSAFTVQQKTYTVQERVAEMQQNIRAALIGMSKDFRMAGFSGEGGAGAGFVAARHDAVVFTADFNEDGDVLDGGGSVKFENIGYDLYTPTGGVSTLGRTRSAAPLSAVETPGGSGHYEVAGHQPLAENIEAIEFNYLMADGTSTTDATTSLSNIRAVQISILARASRPDRSFTNRTTYTAASGTVFDLNGVTAGNDNPKNDNYRRRLLITTVQCRNMGL